MYTCNTCGLQFGSADDQRLHMKSEWHRYNLKRRVAQLPPINEETFNQKVKVLAEAPEKEKTKQTTKKEARRREKELLLEKKKKLLEAARESILQNMGKSELVVEPEFEPVSHPAVEIAADAAQTSEDVAEQLMEQKLAQRVEIAPETCLFCRNRVAKSLEDNLDHMFKSHGFYIPEQKYLVDKPGLVKYLSEKIGLGNICLVCSFQGRSLEAVRAHMLAKNHCRVPYESEDEKLEISEFYDFTSSYADTDATDAAQGGDGDDEDWEDVASDEEGGDLDEAPPQEYLYNDGNELHLPTGVKVGHRSLQKYYRQNLKPETVLTEGQGTVIAAETRHFAKLFDRKEVATQKRVWQTEIKNKKLHDKRGAKFINQQKHYRDQLLQ
ncbi:LAMI_0H10660g1_1 [Lachancea mirantina]|uniref:LAMI_0H10660g1_1 n=1 Tax=Lachancea mirantina TaxID=1230905 RepID=A0A1G4KGP9_9SACH|nr:LAMI_0H10660g1_1 [Lachancea mirantina]